MSNSQQACQKSFSASIVLIEIMLSGFLKTLGTKKHNFPRQLRSRPLAWRKRKSLSLAIGQKNSVLSTKLDLLINQVSKFSGAKDKKIKSQSLDKLVREHQDSSSPLVQGLIAQGNEFLKFKKSWIDTVDKGLKDQSIAFNKVGAISEDLDSSSEFNTSNP